MISPLTASLLAGTVICFIAFVGFGSLLIAKASLQKLLSAIVAFAAGGLLGGAFFHLFPESAEQNGPTFSMALFGIVLFFILDSLLWIYHCHGGHQFHKGGHHQGSCPVKPVGYLNLFGDAIHNITDGIVVASAFIVSIPLGVVTSVAVALHEIPQEVGDFGILIHSGFDRKRALQLNFLVSLAIFLGIIGVFLIKENAARVTLYTIPFAAGGFIYMACTNLLSEIKEEESLKKRGIQFVFFLAGISLLYLTKLWFE